MLVKSMFVVKNMRLSSGLVSSASRGADVVCEVARVEQGADGADNMDGVDSDMLESNALALVFCRLDSSELDSSALFGAGFAESIDSGKSDFGELDSAILSLIVALVSHGALFCMLAKMLLL